MNNSINVSPSAGTATQQLKSSSPVSANNLDSNEDTGDFTAALASVESETDSGEQQLADNNAEPVIEVAEGNYLVDGNSLPAEEQAALWQALLLLQPADNIAATSTATTFAAPQSQSMDLLTAQRKPLTPLAQLNADYFTTMTLKNKDVSASMPAAFASNNINMQLASAQFSPELRETVLLNMPEQLTPIQGTSSTLAQGLAAVGLGTATQAAATQTQMAPLSLGQNAWESNLGSRLQMMVGQNIQTAEIRLDPPELGTLDIKIKVANDTATVNITSANAQVRDALEAALPKLREMFAETGVSLGDVNVRQESFAQQQNSNDGEEGGGGFNNNETDFVDESTTITSKIVSDSLLDIYA